MLDLHRFNPINLLIYGGTKMVYNKVMREASQPSNTIQIPESQIYVLMKRSFTHGKIIKSLKRKN